MKLLETLKTLSVFLLISMSISAHSTMFNVGDRLLKDGVSESVILMESDVTTGYASFFWITEQESIKGCHIDCDIKVLVGDTMILAKRDEQGRYTDQPFTLRTETAVVDQLPTVEITLSNQLNFIFFGEYAFAAWFDRGTGSAHVEKTNSFVFPTTPLLLSNQTMFGGGGSSTDDCPITSSVEDDNCFTLSNSNIKYCWTIVHRDCTDSSVSESRGCIEFPAGESTRCR